MANGLDRLSRRCQVRAVSSRSARSGTFGNVWINKLVPKEVFDHIPGGVLVQTSAIIVCVSLKLVFLTGYGNAVLRCVEDFLESFSAVNSNHGGKTKMASKFYRSALILVALGAFVSVPMLNAQPSPVGNVQDAIVHAKEAVDHGKQGHADALVTHAEKSMHHAERGGKNTHLAEGIKHLKEAIEHGKAGHADVATEHAETALTHLNEVKF